MGKGEGEVGERLILWGGRRAGEYEFGQGPTKPRNKRKARIRIELYKVHNAGAHCRKLAG